MIRFQDPIYLWLLLIIPVVWLIRFVAVKRKQRQMKKFGDQELVKEMMENVSAARPAVKFWLMLSALALLIIMLARPQMGMKTNTEKRQGIEAIVAMDISNSMLAQDVAPSRLDKSKLLVENMINHFVEDKVGLVVFAGDVFVQLPITSDFVSAKMYLQGISPAMMMSQGTDIASAIKISANSFSPDEQTGKAIFIITDGENHEADAVEAAKEVREKGIVVYVLGIGSEKGAPIPVAGGGYMTDQAGETVITKLNEEMCREIAEAGGGRYIHVDNTSTAMSQLDDEIAKLQKGEVTINNYNEYNEQFQAFAIIVIILLILEVIILERKGKTMKWLHLMVVFTLVMASCSGVQPDRKYIRTGNQQYRDSVFAEAKLNYQKAVSANDTNAVAKYNLACSMMQDLIADKTTNNQKQQVDSTVQVFRQAADLQQNPIRKAQAYRNIGWIYQACEQYAPAIDAYKESLRNNPNDDEVRYNLALCQKLLKEQQQNQQQNQQDQKDQNQQNQNDQDQQNQDQQNQDKKDQDQKDLQDQQKQDQQKQDQQQDQQKQDQQQQDQQQQNQQNQDQQQQNPAQPRDGQMSKENAEQLLNAAEQAEKNTQQKMQKGARMPGKRLQKNW